jgi:protocatechuate 3,4-dioxygenase beta subunit
MVRATLLALCLAATASGCLGSQDEDAARPAPARPAPERACVPTEGGSADVTPAADGTPSRITLGPGQSLEPSREATARARRGKPMVVAGVVHTADCEPLAGATVHAWQADASGRYGPGEGDAMRCCYLDGVALTDAHGRFELRSVVPGGYAGGDAHVHIEVGHPRARGLLTELLLDDVRLRGDRVRFDVVLPPD